jgi:hypothetical protein
MGERVVIVFGRKHHTKSGPFPTKVPLFILAENQSEKKKIGLFLLILCQTQPGNFLSTLKRCQTVSFLTDPLPKLSFLTETLPNVPLQTPATLETGALNSKYRLY